MKVNLIVARSQNNVIGKDGEIPWRIAKDFQHFKKATKGHAVVMGKNTFKSLPNVLPERLNIVVSSTLKIDDDNVVVVDSLSSAKQLAKEKGFEILWVIGGERMYGEIMPTVDELWITDIHTTVSYAIGDTVALFKVDLDRQRWVQTKNELCLNSGNGPDCTFNIWKRRSKPSLYLEDILVNEPEQY